MSFFNRLEVKLIGRRTGQYPLAAYEGRRGRTVGLLEASDILSEGIYCLLNIV